MGNIAALEQQLAALQADLDTVNAASDLGDEEAQLLKPALEEEAAALREQIAAAKTSAPPPPPPSTEDAPVPPPSYGLSKHPKSHDDPEDTTSLPPDESKLIFNTGDTVMAKYSADRQWYAATIIGKTGSSTDPLYTIKFTGYPDKETKRKHEVRAIENKKRKAEGPPAPAISVPPPPPPPMAASTPLQHGTVITAAPSIDPTLVHKREPSKVSDGPTRMAPAPKKLKGNRTLEKSKSNWNDWQKSGPKKPAVGTAKKKDSQFRTPDLPNAKVGFTGSGRPMSKDQVRTKWSYGPDQPDAD